MFLQIHKDLMHQVDLIAILQEFKMIVELNFFGKNFVLYHRSICYY